MRDRLRRTEVRSPVAGIVKQLKVHTVGGVIQPGMEMLEIVPRDESLLIEARVKPADIARKGMVRSFQISAVFPHLTVRENVRVALQRQLGTSFHFWKSEASLFPLHQRAEELLAAVDLHEEEG